MNPDFRKEYRDYAWKYFELHAQQRLKAFHFFVIIATVLISTFVTLIDKNGIKGGSILVSAGLIFFSFIFWKLDERTKVLIKNGESAIKLIDKFAIAEHRELEKVDSLALVSADENATKHRSKWHPFNGHYSYSRCFLYVFTLFGFLGILGTICSLYYLVMDY